MADRPTVDGFYPRRPNTRGENISSGGGMGFNEPATPHYRPVSHNPQVLRPSVPVQGAPQKDRDTFRVPGMVAPSQAATPVAYQSGQVGLHRSELEDSLRQIDEDTPETPFEQPRKRRRNKGKKEPATRRKKIMRIVAIVVVLLIVVAAGFFVTKALSAGKQIFNGDVFGLIQQKALQQDANGRTNIILVGTSEDDPGHQGANLTDSIMVLSVDQKAKNAYMVSIPRDLRVQYGTQCLPGGNGKINAYFSCVADGDSKEAEQQRQSAMREFVGKIIGLDIQYSAHVNYSVVRDVVNAIGNITVDIQGSGDAPGVMDSNFDWKCKGGNANASLATMKKNCPPNGHFIDYPNGPVALDAEHVLYLAQARGDAAPTYGLGRSNFDRELNQQKIIKAIKEKAMSAGTLTNLVTVTNLLDAMGNNLRTNFETSEIRTLMTLASDIPNDAVQSISLVDAEPALFGNDGEGNVAPVAGLYDYSGIKAYIQKKINATPVSKEGAHVVVLNASGVVGAAKSESDKLTALGMNVDSIGNAPKTAFTANTIYQIKRDSADAKPNTVKKLQELYGVAPVADTPPEGITPGAETQYIIVIVTPSAAAAATTSTTTDQ